MNARQTRPFDGITLTEVEARSEGVTCQYWGGSAAGRGVGRYACVHVATATGTRTWATQRNGIAFLGSPADVETALYFMDLIQTAMAKTWSKFRRTGEAKAIGRYDGPRKAGIDFRRGVAVRLGERIAATHKQAAAESGELSNGTALVLVKDAMINEWLEQRNMGFRKSRSGSRVGNAYAHGRRAAETIGIGRGIASSERALRLGAL